LSAASDSFESDKRGHKPRERRCVASGDTRDPDVMVRYVLSPDNAVIADVFGKLPGRGVWVSADETSLRKAVKTGGFARGFKTKVNPDADALIEQTRDGLRRQVLRHVTMARKAGRLAFGEVGVREAAARGDVALRIEARDGADRGRGKLRTLSLATARELERPDPCVIGTFSAEEIGAALGRDPVVHAAVLYGPMVAQIRSAAQRLAGFEALVPADWPDARHEPAWPDRNGPESRSGPS
jgi:predicted RNA-binding protein YlxR (DUF448 family)